MLADTGVGAGVGMGDGGHEGGGDGGHEVGHGGGHEVDVGVAMSRWGMIAEVHKKFV